MTRRVVVGTALVASVLLAGCGSSGSDALGGPPAEADELRLAPLTLPAVPGLARTVAEARANDLLLYGEAWLRSRQTAACMADEGFDYVPQALFPEEIVVELAERVTGESTVSTVSAVSGHQQNQAIVAGLTDGQANRYYLALYGETLEAIRRGGEHHGAGQREADLTPDQPFASGGCMGKTKVESGSLGDLRKQLAPDRQQARRQARSTPEFRARQDVYAACMADQGVPGVRSEQDVDQLLIAGPGATDISQVLAAEAECRPILMNAKNAAEKVALQRVLDENSALVAAQVAKYTDFYQRLIEDQEFLRFLTSHAAAIKAGPK